MRAGILILASFTIAHALCSSALCAQDLRDRALEQEK